VEENQQIDPALLRDALGKRVMASAQWFYWIVGLSLVNTVVFFSGGKFTFLIGLDGTQLINGIAAEGGTTAKTIVIFLDIIVLGLYLLLGVLAGKRKHWAFITGSVLYILDGVLGLCLQDWIGGAFHGLALYYIFQGIKANNTLQQLEAATARAPQAATSGAGYAPAGIAVPPPPISPARPPQLRRVSRLLKCTSRQFHLPCNATS
jgi:hypothetical protein